MADTQLNLSNVLPTDRPMGASEDDQFVAQDEFGNKIYETLSGHRYTIRPATQEERDARQPLPVQAKKWWDEGANLPSGQQVLDTLKAIPGEMVNTVDRTMKGEGTVGDFLDTAGMVAAPSVPNITRAADKDTLSMFFSAPKDVSKKAEDMLAAGASEQDIAQQLGVWQDPKSLKWLVETDDSTFDITPYARVKAIATSPSEIRNYTSSPIKDVISGTNILNDVPELQSYRAGIVNPEILKRWGYDENVLGFHDRDFEQVFARRDEDRSTMLHEVQHAIDSIEYNDYGANPQKVYHDLSQIVDNLPAEAKLWLNAKAQLSGVEGNIVALESERLNYLKELKNASSTYSDPVFLQNELDAITEELTGFKRQRNEIKASMKAVEAYDPDLYKNIAKLQEKLKTSLTNLTDEAHSIYEGNEGETRARIVQARADMKPEERYSTNNPLKATENTWSQWDLTKLLNDVQSSLNLRNGLPDPWANVGTSTEKPKFAEGGVVENVDPISGNPVPTGSLPEEVRDDVDAKLSQGEYVLPADVVRFLGLAQIESLVNKAKEGLAQMDAKGRIGGQQEDDLPFSADELQAVDEAPVAQAPAQPVQAPSEVRMAVGGMVPAADTNTPSTASTGLPSWMMQFSLPKEEEQQVVAAPKKRTPAKPIVSNDRSQAERDAMLPTGMAGSVDQWATKDFINYATQRTSGINRGINAAINTYVPMGSVLTKLRQNYLEKNVPKTMEEMLAAGKDLQGKSLSAKEIEDLQSAYDRIKSEELPKNTGVLGTIGSTLKNAMQGKSSSRVATPQPTTQTSNGTTYTGLSNQSSDSSMNSGSGPAWSSATRTNTTLSSSPRPVARPVGLNKGGLITKRNK